MTIWIALLAVAALVVLLYAVRLAGDLAAITIMIVGAAVKVLVAPFRRRH